MAGGSTPMVTLVSASSSSGLLEPDRWGQLMRAALAGDGASYRMLLTELTRAMRIKVRAALGRSGRGNAEVEDIVQDTLLAIHLKRDNWDPALPFAPWVNAIARYKMIDSIRRRGHRIETPIDDLENVLAAPEAADSDLGDAEKLMLRLDHRQQKIVRAMSIAGRSAAEVGAELKMTENAVRVSLHRALKKLGELYRSGQK